MTTLTRRCWWLLPLMLVVLGAVALAARAALAPNPPAREDMRAGETPVITEYTEPVSEADLGLPFYPGAQSERGFAYTVRARDGALVTVYALAVLLSEDSPETVAGYYSERLPGNPTPEGVAKEGGEALVLAIGEGREVRRVSITAAEGGARIELVRAARPVVPAPPYEPRTPGELVL